MGLVGSLPKPFGILRAVPIKSRSDIATLSTSWWDLESDGKLSFCVSARGNDFLRA